MSELKQTKKIDRIVLDPEAMKVILDISHQVQKELGDLVQINPKIIGNFLIKQRASSLTPAEIESLKSESYDIVKALKKATEEAIRLRQNGSQIEYGEILKILQTPCVSEKQPVSETRGRKKKTKDAELKIIDQIPSTQPPSEELS